jgi:undecaprenyl-phosphate 4-deoxy-4-formamido-L-arabinose transferase
MSETSRPLVSFVVPLYFTGERVPVLLDAFRNLPLGSDYELVLVNDGSTDSTMQRVREVIPTMPVPVTVVDLARNFGEHAAVMEGFRHARGEWVINLDDDLQNPVSEALKLLDHARKTDADVVYSHYEEKKHSLFRNFGSWLNSAAATFLLNKPKDLYLSSFRCHKRVLIERIVRYTGPFPYIDGLILGATNRIERLLVDHAERADGESGYNLRRLVRLWMNMFFNFSIMPLRVASVLGVALCFAGLIILGIVLAEHFIYGVPQQGWASLMAAVAIFSGSQLLILGLLGEYVGRTYLTLAGKPQTLVRSVDKHAPNTVLIANSPS